MTEQQINSIILDELRELRTSFNEHAQDTVSRLSSLETHIGSIVGDHQPGRLTLAEKAIKELQQWKWRMAGIATGASAVVSTIIAVMIHFMH